MDECDVCRTVYTTAIQDGVEIIIPCDRDYDPIQLEEALGLELSFPSRSEDPPTIDDIRAAARQANLLRARGRE